VNLRHLFLHVRLIAGEQHGVVHAVALVEGQQSRKALGLLRLFFERELDNLEPLVVILRIELRQERRFVMAVRDQLPPMPTMTTLLRKRSSLFVTILPVISGNANLNGSVGSFTLEWRDGSVGRRRPSTSPRRP
jgi:hypothetical protein